MCMSVVASSCWARDETKPGSFVMFADLPAPRYEASLRVKTFTNLASSHLD